MAETDKTRIRVLRFLSQGAANVAEAASPERLLLDGGERGTISADKKLIAALLREDVLVLAGGELKLVQPERRQELGSMEIDVGDGPQVVAVNLSESPLGQLMRRKGRDGENFLSRAEFQAGERPRADYTRGQIMPRLGANWEASVSSGKRGGGIGDLTDAALAARMRVEKAVRAVGPELSGVLIDVCCFLKGMETVEMERGWPVRSAKIVLKTALGILSRHYSPETGARRKQMLHWGAEDYRPSVS